MELRQLGYFTEAANAGSFSAAAESLFISHQALSKGILTLERELGLDLFVRSSQGIALTEAGGEILRDAHIVMDDVNRLMNRAKSLRDKCRETIRVGMIYESLSNANFSLPMQRLQGFTKAFPKTEIQYIEAGGAQVESMVRTGLLDFGIVAGVEHDNSLGADDFASLLFTHWVVAPRNPLASKCEINWEDLGDTPVIRPPYSSNHFFNALAEKEGFNLNFYKGLTTFRSNLSLTYNDIGVTLITQSQCEQIDLRKARIVPTAQPFLIPVSLIWNKKKGLPHVAAAFRRYFLTQQP